MRSFVYHERHTYSKRKRLVSLRETRKRTLLDRFTWVNKNSFPTSREGVHSEW